MKKKVVPRKRVRLNLYRIVARAVEEGAAFGVSRAYKYTDAPTHEEIAESACMHIMNALSEVITWGPPYD